MGTNSLKYISWIIAVFFYIILTESYVDILIVAETHSITNFRCSHIPPSPDQVTYVWLKDDNFTTTPEEENEKKSNLRNRRQLFERQTNLKEIRNQDSNLISPFDPIESIWRSIFKKTSHNQQARAQLTKDDLVPMKIHIHYDISVYSLEESKFNLINDTVMPSVVKFFESVLSIRKEHKIDTFKITRRCPNNTIYYAKDSTIGQARPYCMEHCEDYAICGEVTVPKNHLSACSYCNSTNKRCTTNYQSEGEGVSDAQLVLYVSAKQTTRCKKDQTIAYAAHCAQDSKTDRPVAGHANLCPSSISTDVKDLRALIATVKHELTHVLGFSISLFAYYRDEFGNPLTDRDQLSGPISVDPSIGYAKWSDKIIRKVIRTDWLTGEGKKDKEIHMIVTPTVVREVRQYFNCSTLEGAELEDQGLDGTSMTHWEKRLFENEAMTGTHTQNSVYSRITLALLQDTGWYISNFTRAEKLEWGKNLGCDFAKKSCKSWIDDRRSEGKSIRPFCDRVKGDLLQIACTEDRSSKAVCNMKQYKEPLPLAYQNFNHLVGVNSQDLPLFGGSVDLADYCPFIQEFTWQTQNITVRGSRCDLSGINQDTDRNAALELYGPQAKCFEHGRRWEQRSCSYKRHWHHYGAGCYKFLCTNNHFNIIVGNYSYPCYYPNQVIRVEQLVDQWLYNGTIICPSCEKICTRHKCKSFDRRLIDELFFSNNQMTKMSENDVSVFVEQKINFIETENMLESNLIEFRNNSSKKIKLLGRNAQNSSEEIDYKNRLVDLINNHQQPPKHLLVCSGCNVCKFQISIMFLSMIVLYIIR